MPNIHDIVTHNLKILETKLARIRIATNHSSIKGTLLEKAVCDFFQTMLPNNLGITSGFIIDSNGNQSTQLDLIIYDNLKGCTFFNEGGISILPCEFVHCAIEVKTSINSTELQKCAEASRKIKQLERKAFYKNTLPITHEYNYYGKTYGIGSTGCLPPPIYIIFSLEATANLETLKSKLIELDLDTPHDQRIDFLFTPNGAITNFDKYAGSNLIPCEKTERYVHNDTRYLGLWFYGMLSKYLYQFKIESDFNFLAYYESWVKQLPSC